MEVVEAKGFMLLPPAEGKCRICAVEHPPTHPHDASSLFYQTRFKLRYKRQGTWADAIAHCADEVKAVVGPILSSKGKWSEPPEGVAPIPEPIDS